MITIKDYQKIKSVTDFRLSVISPIISLSENDPKYKENLKEQITKAALNSGKSQTTIKRWFEAYKKNGIQGLNTKYKTVRIDKKLTISFDVLFEEAKIMRLQDPTISVNNIIKCLESRYENIDDILKRGTLQTHLYDAGYGTHTLLSESETSGKGLFGRYRKTRVMEQIQGDIKEPPCGACVDEKGLPITPYIQIWMDNHSRKILHYKIGVNQDYELIFSSFKELIIKYGIPETILTDLGSLYRGVLMEHCVHTLGIVHKYSRQSKPEVTVDPERLNETEDCVVTELKTMKNLKFSEFVRIFDAWVKKYNDTPHSALTECDDQGNKTQRTPNEAFDLGLKKITVRIPNSDLIERAFTQSIARKVSKDGLISYGGRYYKIASKYAKAHEYINLISSLTDRNFLELVVPNSEEEKRNGGSEYTTIPLYPLGFKSKFDFKDRVKDEQSKEKV